jgi:DNA transposition AAA+ family ATPase
MWWGHSKKQCVTALVGVKELLDRISYMNDEQVRKYTCDSAKEIINQLLREKDKNK